MIIFSTEKSEMEGEKNKNGMVMRSIEFTTVLSMKNHHLHYHRVLPENSSYGHQVMKVINWQQFQDDGMNQKIFNVVVFFSLP